ncbi:MAG: sulfatase-like hydrolase/transferase [Armatimonadetes bacterium]|nr:sulfatase-like hydrolase/transferase [Armatimonadota bacterium]
MDDPKRDLALALSAANLLFLPNTLWLLNNRWMVFHARLPLSVHLTYLFVNILLFALLGYGCIRWVRKSKSPWPRKIAEFLFLVQFLFTVKGTAGTLMASRTTEFQFFKSLVKPPGLLIAGPVFLIVAYVLWKHSRKVTRVLRTVVAALLPIFFIDVLWGVQSVMSVQSGGAMADKAPPKLHPAPPQEGLRVVWVILDEWEYRLSFAERPKELNFPAFDRLRSQSLFFSDARSPASRTEFSMPSFFTGKSFKWSVLSSPNKLTLKDQQGKESDFRTHRTLFEEVQDLGRNSALVGIFLPYGRLLGDVTHVTWWQPPGVLGESDNHLENLTQQWALSVGDPFKTMFIRKGGIRANELGIAQTQRLIDDPNYSFVFAHLFPPHPPCYWDRRKGGYTAFSFFRSERTMYEDSLLLADNMADRLLDTLLASPLEKNTVFIVTTDHTNRDAEKMELELDARIPCMIRFPGGKAGQADFHFNNLALHDLVLAIMKGEVKDQDQTAAFLKAWMAKHPETPGFEIKDGIAEAPDVS